MAVPSEILSGTCQQLLFSPKGGIEGALMKAKGAALELSMRPGTGVAFARNTGPGKRRRVLAAPDHMPKTRESAHPVCHFAAFADAQGHAIEMAGSDPENTTIKGVVEAIRYARHGQPNGVGLETGEFIHMRPRGTAEVILRVGATVSAVGALRLTVLGTRLLDVREVNRIELA